MPTIDKLPTHPYIKCSTVGCTTMTTCFGKNLQAKIASYGSLETLLKEFVCRGCRNQTPLNIVKMIVPRKKRITKKETRAKKIADLIHTTPVYKPATRKSYLLKDSPEFVAEITKESGCIRPDIFLDNDRVCDDCPYNQHCQANNKSFSKRYKPVLAAA